MRALFATLPLLCLLAHCSQPPQSAYLGGTPISAQGASAINLGTDANGQSCNQLPSGTANTVDIYCGTWQQPAARVRTGDNSSSTTLMTLATSGPWREAIDLRYACDNPTPTSILGGQSAVLLQCRRRVGGWPETALIASVGGRAYLAEGILPVTPVMERSIGILSGTVSSGSAAMPTSATDTLLANQLAARAFGANDVGEYERLMALGARTNLAENFAAAETAYRAAYVLQQKTLGRNSPDTVNALMHLALQVSDEGRFAEADSLFQQADALAPRATDKAAIARLSHYRALHQLNQGHVEQALALLERASAGYAALVPPETLRTSGSNQAAQRASTASATDALDLPNQRLMNDPTAQSALMGLIETKRYQAIALRMLGRTAESETAIASANELASANRMTVPLVAARLTRTSATTESSSGRLLPADVGLAISQADFNQVLPQTRPVAETALLRAGNYAAQGTPEKALDLCRTAVTLLRTLQSGSDPALLEPCLASFAKAAERDPTNRQRLLAEMFEAAQLAQGSVTSRQIGEAAARLAANSRDPKVAEAIRRRQDAADNLAELYRERDALASRTGPPVATTVSPAELDKNIANAQTELADASAALQAAAPNYGQLVQAVIPTADVLAALAPDEAFVAVTLTKHGGWTFVLRNSQITVAPVHGDADSITALVKRVRASIEPTTAGVPQFDTTSAHSLYEATLGPVAAQLANTKSLIVAPSGPLLSLPFAVFLTGPANPNDLAGAPWLIRQVTITHIPSAANFVSLRKAGPSHAARPWYGFGGFRPVTLAQAEATFPSAACQDSAKLFASLPPLPSAQRELGAARQILGGSASDELLNAAFTADAVRRASLKDYRILHFATHALLPTELRCQDEPAIVTSAPPNARNASGALLPASDVVKLDLDADLIILSACNSGGPGGSTAGESLSGLARAFFYAGARSLAVTHWAVNDQVAAFLVVDTLRRLHENPRIGVAGALRDAQLALLDSAGKGLPAEITHPFFWAPFAAIGEGSGRATVNAESRVSPRQLAGL